ncbi:dolichyl-phosphate-mannose-protein mannosyltransferase [Thermosporothrix hazakensis]|jgi:hypothetical protein|uniref:Dolichyl-phosphate-mannose-protein mannosyltransferase n=1 Tax=Thermosporothrix hazakensis TaxID=644383 RepID=A0A326U577_THEHA|nr:phospholipid carrier-dependent glycosyltransferase [Thermosporothrix hazakensis]PZW24839.1 dolichyl-phosphate-mannose-protein mannosyltransferase [Thermosporothrix hazakensis]GCE46471.1 hypothetical protein KTH_13400 [Thermosporothrix hazakensis]
MKQTFVDPQPISVQPERPPARLSARGVLLCASAFLLCNLLYVTPLYRLTYLPPHNEVMPPPGPLTAPGAWLPAPFAGQLDPVSANALLFLLLNGLLFSIYGLCAWCLSKQPETGNYRLILRLILGTTLLVCLISIFSPAMISHDIFAYAGNGRQIVTYHESPYFALMGHHADPINRYHDWRYATSAYGPFWQYISAAIALYAGPHALIHLYSYRVLLALTHLVNSYLILRILRRQGCTERTVMLGVLLYAWNPLTLLESAHSAHNDIMMITFLLLGAFLWQRIEQRPHEQRARLSLYLPVLFSVSLALLIKYSAAPLLALFFVLMARQLFDAHRTQTPGARWRLVLLKLLAGAGFCLLLGLIGYVPLWIGHSIPEIVASFSTPPSAGSFYHSISYSIVLLVKQNGIPATGWLHTVLPPLAEHSTWSVINALVLGPTLIYTAVRLWRTPTLRNWTQMSLLFLFVLFFVVPWFFPWYLTWSIGIAALALPVAHERLGRALLGASVVFSASVYSIYFYLFHPPAFGDWQGWDFLYHLVPPLLAFLALYFWPAKALRVPKRGTQPYHETPYLD